MKGVSDRIYELRISGTANDEGGVFVVAIDVTEQRDREGHLRFRATHDDMTGLHNRAAFVDHTELAMARLRRRPSMVAVLFVDLDDFKACNDRFGHAAGDTVLKRVAFSFRQAIRETDLLARFGGDEFVILCDPLRGPVEADHVARRVLATLDEPILTSPEGSVSLSASVGIACAKDPTESATDLIGRADAALYQAKSRGSRAGERRGLGEIVVCPSIDASRRSHAGG